MFIKWISPIWSLREEKNLISTQHDALSLSTITVFKTFVN